MLLPRLDWYPRDAYNSQFRYRSSIVKAEIWLKHHLYTPFVSLNFLQTSGSPHRLVGFNQPVPPRIVSSIPRSRHHQVLQVFPIQLVFVLLLSSQHPGIASCTELPSRTPKAELYGFHTTHLTRYPHKIPVRLLEQQVLTSTVMCL